MSKLKEFQAEETESSSDKSKLCVDPAHEQRKALGDNFHDQASFDRNVASLRAQEATAPFNGFTSYRAYLEDYIKKTEKIKKIKESIKWPEEAYDELKRLNPDLTEQELDDLVYKELK